MAWEDSALLLNDRTFSSVWEKLGVPSLEASTAQGLFSLQGHRTFNLDNMFWFSFGVLSAVDSFHRNLTPFYLAAWVPLKIEEIVPGSCK